MNPLHWARISRAGMVDDAQQALEVDPVAGGEVVRARGGVHDGVEIAAD